MSEFRFFAYTDFEFHTNRSQNLLNLPISPFQPTRRTTTDEISHELNVPYTVFEILVAVFAVIGNLMVIIVFQRDRKLRRRTNYYIVSLAMADFLVGSLGVPFAILASIGMPTNLHACLFTVSLLVVLCTISIFCLVAVSVDRYWAILYPMAYSRNVRTKTAIVIISLCWLAGTVVGFLPLFGWHADVGPNQACLFVEVMDYNYLVFLYFATIITPALLMLAFYAHIYRVIIKQVRQIVTMNPVGDCSRRSSTAQIQLTATGMGRGCHGGTMLRVLGAARKRDVKATQNLSIIVLFFMICWIPLYTINCVKAFCPDCYVHPKLTLFCIILSHLNSAVNPVLYAYHLKDFRAALKNLILKIMGVEVEPPNDALHRFSMASQHRLQSMDSSVRNTMQPRIYVDSPIWLRQQQQTLKGASLVPKCGVVSPCLGNSIGQIHQTVAAVASVPADIEREMWNIVEAPSGAEMGDVHYEFPDLSVDGDVDRSSGTPVPPKRRRSRQKRSSCDSPYSYSNRNYSTSPDDSADVVDDTGDDVANDDDANVNDEAEVEFDDVFLPAQRSGAVDAKQLNRSLIACAMREKLRADDADAEYQQQLHSSQRALTDSSYSDYDHTPPTGDRPTSANPVDATTTTTTAANLAQAESLSQSQSSSNSCLANSAVFVIDDSDTNPLSPGHKPKFRKAANSTLSSRRPCTSDSSSPTGDLTSAHVVRLLGGAANNSSNSSSSSHSVVGGKHNNNSHTTNNLNYYTIHHPSPAQQNPNHLPHQHRLHPPEKFSPLKAMSNFIFPPIVKHSSLFQLFQPSASGATPTVVAAVPTRPEKPNSSNGTASTEVDQPVVTAAES